MIEDDEERKEIKKNERYKRKINIPEFLH